MPTSFALPAVDGEGLLAFSLWCVPGMGRARAELLKARFGTLREALGQPAASLIEAGLPAKISALVTGGGAVRRGEAALRACERLGVWTLQPGDPEWPQAFERLAFPPGVLFGLGAKPSRPAVGVVGSRASDAFGLELARLLGRDLGAAGVSVVSGGALGVDGAAHEGALLMTQAATVAVLGCGLDLRYPPQHAGLLEKIATRGSLVTELPPGVPPRPAHFPRRNRLIAALSDALVVVRAASRSGALGTAREAQRLGLPIFAAPGPTTDLLSRGTELLLKEGASPCRGASDVLRALGLSSAPLPHEGSAEHSGLAASARRSAEPPSSLRRAAGSQSEATLLELLGPVPVNIDSLAREARLSPADASAALTRLELAGLAAREPGNIFHRPRGS